MLIATVYVKVWHGRIEFSKCGLVRMTSCGIYLAVSPCVVPCGVLMGAER